jgi:hypothetical protein
MNSLECSIETPIGTAPNLCDVGDLLTAIDEAGTRMAGCEADQGISTGKYENRRREK